MNKLLKIKTGSALLIILLVISISSALALTLARSLISNIGYTTNISDAMIAEEASQAGVEMALLRYKNGDKSNFEKTISSTSPESRVEVVITESGGTVTIVSTGISGGVRKKHILTQRNLGSIFTGNVQILQALSAQEVLSCETIPGGHYVATGAGHWATTSIPKESGWGSIDLHDGWPSLKCSELVSDISIDYGDLDPSPNQWEATVNTGSASIRIVDSGNYVIFKSGHWQSVNEREYPAAQWVKIDSSDYTLDYSSTFHVGARDEIGMAECPAETVMIGDGHFGGFFASTREEERIICARFVPIEP
ncbi:hypothetical protein A2V71_04290 [Candidatus Berkelbacteria bacterium RBG_13_40_8]|uniref:Uncharacterized protein n=1 Tax=Candidatus Berkelbacteria bacterium RBG_13_40_8 TaxID=1797467 RepID=A0A1F5DNL3_9BACT|nr:MAG: hypothetical protein A2V71_04290 [Candidatus Berkelbacteria bacterium RBG_13_40_8]